MVRKSMLLLGLMLLVTTTAAFADWDLTMPAKWVQRPDEMPTGIDVSASYNFILADDFECWETGPITDIHIWGSWLYDILPENGPDDVIFTLSIHGDIPADESPTGYSIPGDVLWYRQFQRGEFTVRVWLDGVSEGWMEPPDVYIQNADDTD